MLRSRAICSGVIGELSRATPAERTVKDRMRAGRRERIAAMAMVRVREREELEYEEEEGVAFDWGNGLFGVFGRIKFEVLDHVNFERSSLLVGSIVGFMRQGSLAVAFHVVLTAGSSVLELGRCYTSARIHTKVGT